MSGNQNINSTNNLADQQYWDDAYASYTLLRMEHNKTIYDWIRNHLPQGSGKSCFEIGCFPGRFLTIFGDLGYELNGLDLTPRVTQDFPIWLQENGYKTGEFYREDFFRFTPARKYDVVASFGFIEHFKNWEEVFRIHMNWVADEGYLVIETPNFRGWFQRLIHLTLDLKNYRRHYIPSMSPSKWKKLAEDAGFEIVHAGYMGEFEFWIDEQPKDWFRIKLLNQLIKNYSRLKKMPAGRKAYAPYCGIIARKKK